MYVLKSQQNLGRSWISKIYLRPLHGVHCSCGPFQVGDPVIVVLLFVVAVRKLDIDVAPITHLRIKIVHIQWKSPNVHGNIVFHTIRTSLKGKNSLLPGTNSFL